MILVLNICRDRLHYYEFVKPVEDILDKENLEFETFHYKQRVVFSKYDKIIFCGTSLADNDFLENLDMFSWLENFEGQVFGICAGFQILGKTFGAEIKRGEVEIGFLKENFDKDFFGIKGKVEVYHLHSNYLEFGDNWEILSFGKVVQAVKLKGRDFFGVLFHPEVRNKEMILEFARL